MNPWAAPARTAPTDDELRGTSNGSADDLEVGGRFGASASLAPQKGAGAMQEEVQRRQRFALHLSEQYLRSPVAAVAMGAPSYVPAPLVVTGGKASSPYPESARRRGSRSTPWDAE